MFSLTHSNIKKEQEYLNKSHLVRFYHLHGVLLRHSFWIQNRRTKKRKRFGLTVFRWDFQGERWCTFGIHLWQVHGLRLCMTISFHQCHHWYIGKTTQKLLGNFEVRRYHLSSEREEDKECLLKIFQVSPWLPTVKAMKPQAHDERHAHEILRTKFIINTRLTFSTPLRMITYNPK